MKTMNLKNWKAATRFALLAAMAVLTVVSTGCGKKKSNNNPSAYTGYGAGPNCTNCVGGANALLSSALGEKSQGSVPLRIQIGLEFYGQGAVQPQPSTYPGQYGGNPYSNYRGQVQAQGRMRITQADPYCGILPQHVGDYTLTTIQAGEYSGGMIYNMMLQASGPYPFTIRLDRTMINNSPTASVGFDGRQYPNRLQNDIFINNCRYVIE